MTVVNRFVQAVSHGGLMTRPTLIVIHSAETPLKAGYANSIATNWFGKSATTSAHFMVDPVEIIRMLSDNVVSYAVGPKANGFTLNIEQAGYARFSRAEWTTVDGLTQLGKVGALVRELADAHGIPLRWASDAQILAASKGTPGGICFHDDIHRVLGGTTHTDPVPNYPADIVMANPSKTASVSEEDELNAKQDAQLDSITQWTDPNNGALAKLLRDVLNTVTAPIHSTVPGSDVSLTPRDMLASVDNNAFTTAQQMAALVASNNAIADAIRNNVGNNGGITTEQAIAAGQAGADAALKQLGQELAN